MKLKKAAALTAGAALTVGAASAFVYHEIIERSGTLFKLVADAVTAKMLGDPQSVDPREEWFLKQDFEEYTITNDDGNRLKGYLLKADEPSDVYVFGSHGYRCFAKREFRLFTKFWHDKGYNVFIVDHTASGESEGEYIGFGYFEKRDCLKWLSFLKENFGDDIKIILHGVSMGSATVMLMTGDDALPENVKFTVADCGYTSAYDEFKYCLKAYHIPKEPLFSVVDFLTKKKAGYDLRDTSALNAVKKAKAPILFVHGKDDDFVPTYMATELYDACTSKKDLLLVDGAYHAQSYQTNSALYEEKLNEFCNEYID